MKSQAGQISSACIGGPEGAARAAERAGEGRAVGNGRPYRRCTRQTPWRQSAVEAATAEERMDDVGPFEFWASWCRGSKNFAQVSRYCTGRSIFSKCRSP